MEEDEEVCEDEDEDQVGEAIQASLVLEIVGNSTDGSANVKVI